MSEMFGRAARGLYRLAGYAALPLVPPFIAWRTAKGKEERARRAERYGHPSARRPDGPLVWVHVASVGETNAVLPLIGRLRDRGIAVLLTSVTVTSAAIAARRLPSGAIHQYAPLDIEPFIDRFLDAWRPDLALFFESELWPTMITRLMARNIPQARINARMTERSFARWKRLAPLMRPLFAANHLTLAQSRGDAERLAALGFSHVRAAGNLKFDVPAPHADAAALAAFAAATAGRRLFLAASTHEGEESIVAAAHRASRALWPDFLTIIVPRHPARGAAIRSLLAAEGFVVAQRSAGEGVTPATDIYLADTLGELGLFYPLAPVVFVGGTLVPVGGHNPIEAVKLGAAVLHGPMVANAAEIYAGLDAAVGRAPVENAAALAAALSALIGDPARLAAEAASARAGLAPYAGALDAALDALEPLLAPLGARAGGKVSS